jgi:multidrug efflux pump subunit AcrA (membrane-fusion protein)
MKTRLSRISPVWFGCLALIVVAGLAWAVGPAWIPRVRERLTNLIQPQPMAGAETVDPGHAPDHPEHGDHDHGDHGHAHEESTSLEISEQGRRNIGLRLGEVELQTYVRMMNVPAMVTERPGRTKIQVATPMTGVVTNVYVIKGEAVHPGKLMFKIRLTHEDLVQAQTRFVQTLGEHDVETREIARLEEITTGLVARKVILEHEYSKQKLEALLSAQREALLLHGLSESQVGKIEETRKLLRELQIFSPSPDDDSEELRLTKNPIRPVSLTRLVESDEDPQPADAAPPYVIQELNVYKGQSLQAGQTLVVLADYSELYIEGKAFEHDSDELQAAAQKGWKVSAVREDNKQHAETVSNLQIVYVANEIEPISRSLNFYVGLPNEIIPTKPTDDGHRFIDWKFKPGQRMQLRVPVAEWKDRIVLPADAVAQEGVEFYVFVENGDHFDRIPVHVEYSDQFSMVIANDGSLFPGDTVALSGAHQMQVALKNKAGGAPDPHAGHSH